MISPLFAWLGILVLVAVHLTAGKLTFLSALPRSRWLSFGGGISVAYAFMHLLPELSEHQETLSEASDGSVLGFMNHHVYLIALGGLAFFYGVERLAKRSRKMRAGEHADHAETATSPAVFWVSIASFGIYNALIGYLVLHGSQDDLASLALFLLAMALHFIVNDFGLELHHKHMYQRAGRWIVSAAIVLGALVGNLTDIPAPAIAVLVAFLGGGIILNVMKEELPEDRESRFSAFALGAFSYAALLVLL